ncbi:MAG: di-heme enzyme [Spirochaetae bacterium HGW-Spirochaetae-10]|nr:MAG: di-heme enzyme [Spirochaetae bacterium HGW-Spirochaetae-10]
MRYLIETCRFGFAAIVTALVAALPVSCGCESYNFRLPEGISPPVVPDVCVTEDAVELGRRLFYDERLSGNGEQSCASCHIQSFGFTDGRKNSVGSTGQVHPRNAMPLANVAYFKSFTWAQPSLKRLDNQMLIPFFAEDTKTTIEELAIGGREHVVIARLKKDPQMVELFRRAFPDRPINVVTMTKAISAFEATLLSFQSAYDRGVMTDAARRGEALFRSERLNCSSCHGGILFNEDVSGGEGPGSTFRNVGLYNVGNRGDYPDGALHPAAGRQTQGLYAVTGDRADRGRFRIPSLRNVAVTAPYMHDGSIATLAGAIEHFNAGGRNIASGPFAGDGRLHPAKDGRVRPLFLTGEEKADLLAFLEALTDDCFLNDPAFADPALPPLSMPDYCSK